MKLSIVTLFLVVFIALSHEREVEVSQNFNEEKLDQFVNLLKKFPSEEQLDDISNEEEKNDVPNLYLIKDPLTIRWKDNEYYHGKTDQSWEEARKVCQSVWGPGNGDLVKIDNKEENDIIYNLFVVNFGNPPMWIGANDKETPLDFHWSLDNSKMTYTNWARNEPDNKNDDERCVHFFSGPYWNDLKCDSKFWFICERKITTFQTDLMTIKWKGNEYYYDQGEKNYDSARKVCQSVWGPGNGDLVKIDNKEENDFLYDQLIVKNGNKFTWIGANDKETALKFHWSADDSEVTYTNWDHHQPDNHGGNEKCVQFHQNNKWNDISCDFNFQFICEAKKTGVC